jgi:hypothetical protein
MPSRGSYAGTRRLGFSPHSNNINNNYKKKGKSKTRRQGMVKKALRMLQALNDTVTVVGSSSSSSQAAFLAYEVK